MGTDKAWKWPEMSMQKWQGGARWCGSCWPGLEWLVFTLSATEGHSRLSFVLLCLFNGVAQSVVHLKISLWQHHNRKRAGIQLRDRHWEGRAGKRAAEINTKVESRGHNWETQKLAEDAEWPSHIIWLQNEALWHAPAWVRIGSGQVRLLWSVRLGAFSLASPPTFWFNVEEHF